MGAERYLSLVLSGKKKGRYDISADIRNKHVLIIPGYGNNAFLFAEAGAKKITVYDKDPVTIAWIKAFKMYFHYRGPHSTNTAEYPSVGELLTALTCWYPPRLRLPTGLFTNAISWIIYPQLLRRTYIFYMLSLVQHAVVSQVKDNVELNKDIEFYAGDIDTLLKNTSHSHFDTIFVPYLLGVRNGIENEQEIIYFIKQLTNLVPNGRILVNPSHTKKEFHIIGQRYFVTTGYPTIPDIPDLKPYLIDEDQHWFKTQGLAVFGNKR